MFLKILLNYILGYVNIKVEGFFIERFIYIIRKKLYYNNGFEVALSRIYAYNKVLIYL